MKNNKRERLGGGFVSPVAEPASDLTPAQRAMFRKKAKSQAAAKAKLKTKQKSNRTRSRIQDADFAYE